MEKEQRQMRAFASESLISRGYRPDLMQAAAENPAVEAERLLRELREGADELRAWLPDAARRSWEGK